MNKIYYRLIKLLAEKIEFNKIYKTYFELSQSSSSEFLKEFSKSENIFLKFAIYLNPNFDVSFKRYLLGSVLDEIMEKYNNVTSDDELKILRNKLNSLFKYQGIFLDYKADYLYTGAFSKYHERFASMDPHIDFDVDYTRLRTFNLFQVSQQVLKKFHNKGEFLFAGINYGTAPLILTHLHKNKEIKFIYIDPFDGRKNIKVNLNPNFFMEKLPSIDYKLIKGVIPDHLPYFKNLIFVHLNTTNFEAEFASMNFLLENLQNGGVIIWDMFGWLDENLRVQAHSLLDQWNIFSIILPTRQLLIIKN